VHFLGWTDKWDQKMSRTTEDLQKLHSVTRKWRDSLKVGSLVEVRGQVAGVKWFSGTVEGLKEENGVRLVKVGYKLDNTRPSQARWLDVQGEEICEGGTHISIPVSRTEISGNGRASRLHSSSSSSALWDRPNTKGVPLVSGAVGLQNLGNTCFMNSMLQCLLAAEPLTNHFLSRGWIQDLNENNALGMNGKMAEAYDSLVTDAFSGEFSSVVPSKLKRVIGDFAPAFAGYQQQDSQELMSFLLDGLHEDLNRVHKKPYVEAVESGGRPDAVVAEESWRRYLMRNDSIIVDKCMGLLRSHVTCPNCSHESVTFDPYMSLPLPLPVENVRKVDVLVRRLPHGGRPIKVVVTLPAESSVRDLKSLLCARLNHLNRQRIDCRAAEGSREGAEEEEVKGLVTEDRLALMEVWSHKVYKSLLDASLVMDIKPSDIILACECEHPLPPLDKPPHSLSLVEASKHVVGRIGNEMDLEQWQGHRQGQFAAGESTSEKQGPN
ncbi:unnamed protein product, partial [Discosporangium mesarthrocarpum]